jgi:hypothetical protein
MFPARDRDTSSSDKVHILRAGRVEAFPPHVEVKASPGAAKVGVSQVLVEVETGTRADDLGIRNISNEISGRDIRDSHRHLRKWMNRGLVLSFIYGNLQ